MKNIGLRLACALSAVLLVCSIAGAQQAVTVGPFLATGVQTYNAGNMTVRILGMPAVAGCTGGTTWAYVDETDSGAKEKIAFALGLYLAGKSMSLVVTPVNFFGNGVYYCQVLGVYG